jgi:hypothetical protein
LWTQRAELKDYIDVHALLTKADIPLAKMLASEPPERALAEPVRFLTYVMTYATTEEIAVVRRYVQLDDFREALEHAPPGIMDARSWAYWNAVTGRYPVPPMPRRIGLHEDPD